MMTKRLKMPQKYLISNLAKNTNQINQGKVIKQHPKNLKTLNQIFQISFNNKRRSINNKKKKSCSLKKLQEKSQYSNKKRNIQSLFFTKLRIKENIENINKRKLSENNYRLKKDQSGNNLKNILLKKVNDNSLPKKNQFLLNKNLKSKFFFKEFKRLFVLKKKLKLFLDRYKNLKPNYNGELIHAKIKQKEILNNKTFFFEEDVSQKNKMIITNDLNRKSISFLNENKNENNKLFQKNYSNFSYRKKNMEFKLKQTNK